MNNYAKLIESHIISFKEVIVLNYKKIGLNEQEAMIIILLYEHKKHHDKAISVKDISQYVTFTEQELSSKIVSLVERGYIELEMKNNVEVFSLKPTIEKLGNSLANVDEKIIYKDEIKEIIADLEKKYSRPLKASELLIIKEWFNQKIDVNVIKKTIENCYQLNKLNIKYIDSILSNQVNRNKDVIIDEKIEEVLKRINVRK